MIHRLDSPLSWFGSTGSRDPQSTSDGAGRTTSSFLGERLMEEMGRGLGGARWTVRVRWTKTGGPAAAGTASRRRGFARKTPPMSPSVTILP